MVVPTSGTRIRCFFASSTPLRMDSGTSPALPSPTPTWPWPSPTTTTALNEKRRPPLTTLATRLIWTTRSSSVRRAGSILGMTWLFSWLEVESGFARGVGQGAHAAVIAETGAVEDDLLDARCASALGEQLADLLGVFCLGALARAQAALERGGAGQRLAGGVVDQLGVDLADAPEDGQARPLGRTGQGQAQAGVALLARRIT